MNAYIEVDKSWNPSHLIDDDEKFAESKKPSKITPFLWLSGWNMACDAKFLSTNKIRGILCFGDSEKNSKPAYVMKMYSDLKINYEYIQLVDNLSEDISKHFDAIWNFLSTYQAMQAPALIHCPAGISRAPAALLYYMVRRAYDRAEKPKQDCTDTLHKMLQERRSCIDVNPDFLNQIRKYECTRTGKKFEPVKFKLDLEPVEQKSERGSEQKA